MAQLMFQYWGPKEKGTTLNLFQWAINISFNILIFLSLSYLIVFYNVSFYNIGQRMQIIAFLLRRIRFQAKKTIQMKTISSSER